MPPVFNLYRKSAVTVLLVLVILFLTAILGILLFLSGNSFKKGVTVNNIDLSGMNWEQAERSLNKHFNSIFKNKNTILTYQDRSWQINLSSINLYFDAEEVLHRAYSTGRTGGIVKRLRSTYNARKQGAKFYCCFDYDKDKLGYSLAAIKKEIDVMKENAEVRFRDGKFTIIDEKYGLQLDLNKCETLFEKMINAGKTGGFELPVKVMVPRIKSTDIIEINSVLGRAETVFNENNLERSHNISLASNKISGMTIMPGQIFSMNSALGTRTLANGYREAPAIIKDDLAKSIGGGICQVSSTLYISLLKAGFPVVERKPHTFPLNYVPPGQDATIAENYIDLKFSNNRDYAVAIQAEVSGNKLSVMLLGKNNTGTNSQTELKSEIIEEWDPGEPEFIVDDIQMEDSILDREARKGFRVIVWREISVNGRLTARDKVSDDFYRPLPARYKISHSYYESNKDRIKALQRTAKKD